MGVLRTPPRWFPVLLLAVAALSPAGAQHWREYDLKAAFLLNFVAFVEWPGHAVLEPGQPYIIGVLGIDPFGAVLDDVVRGERMKGRPIIVRRFARLSDVAECHILFISASERPRLKDVLRACAGRPILTVGDLPHFVHAGGMIGFSTEGNRIVLAINPERTEAAGLVVSSKLLRVAQVVHLREDGR